MTAAVLDEFAILRSSFESAHGRGHHWFIRCDRESLPALSRFIDVTCAPFTECQAVRPSNESVAFRQIVGQKIDVLEDAWAARRWAGVAFLDADLVFTGPLMDTLTDVRGDLILTPNYYPPAQAHLGRQHGDYNSGFVFARTPRFHQWWRDAYDAGTSLWAEQLSLNDAPAHFEVATLGPDANVGFWRSASMPVYDPIPPRCSFVHVHLYQPLGSWRQWIDKSFALHCVKFLQASDRPEHRKLFDEILARDRHGWFEASLRVCGLWPASADREASLTRPAAGH